MAYCDMQVTTLPRATVLPSVEEALTAYKTGTTREFAELLNLDLPVTAQVLEIAGAHRMPAVSNEFWTGEGSDNPFGTV